MTFTGRIFLTIVIVLAVLVLVAASERVSDRYALSQPSPRSPYDEHLIGLDKLALDHAYQQQIEHLFQVWMKDSSGQPQRATVGAQQARRAYSHAAEQIEKRERELRPR